MLISLLKTDRYFIGEVKFLLHLVSFVEYKTEHWMIQWSCLLNTPITNNISEFITFFNIVFFNKI